MKKIAYRHKTLLAALVVALIALSVVLVAASIFPVHFAYAQTYSSADEELCLLQDVLSVDARENFRFLRYDPVAFGRVYRFQQIHDGVDVVGAQMTVSVDENGKILSYGGKFVPIPAFGSKKVAENEAKSIIWDKYQDDIIFSQFVYYFDGQNVYPAYKLISSSMTSEYYVSALDGSVLYKNTSQYIAMQNEDAFGKKIDIEVAKEGEKYVLHDEERGLSVLDFGGKAFKSDNSDLDFVDHLDKILTSSTGTDFDGMAVTVYDHVAKAYDFYLNPSNIGVARYGINDKNNNDDPSDDYIIYILMNYGRNYTSADFRVIFSSEGKLDFGYICVGNGEQTESELYEQGKAFDIIAHEYQHGVTAFTANFNYVGESGALDEAFSDIFGSLIEGNDPSDLTSGFWTIGEDGVYDPHDKGLYLRSLISGTKGQVYNIDDKLVCNRPGNHENHGCDKNYVHANSTIISRIQYELSSLSPQFFTRERIGTLWYTTLLKLTQNATFLDFTNAFISSAMELDFPQSIQQNVTQALTNVRLINDGQQTITFYGPNNEILLQTIVKEGDKFNFSLFKQALQNDITTEKCTYKFVEWHDADGNILDENIFKKVTSNINVYASYDVFCFATFLDENGDVLSKTEYAYRSVITAFEYSSFDQKKYNKVLGWRTPDMADDQYVDLSNFTIYENTTFIPILQLKTYTVRYYSDDSLIHSQQAAYGSIIQLPTNDSLTVQHNGLTLEGWYLDKNLTVKADNFTIVDNVDLYAKWITDEEYDQTKLAIIIGASLACVFIICIPIIIIITKRRKR